MDIYEKGMHDHMLEIIEQAALSYCWSVPACSYMGRINLHVIPKEVSNHYYERIDVGPVNPNSFYVIELIYRSNECRYRFGRIEEITTHHLYRDVKWYAFRERINSIHDENDEDRSQNTTEWSNEIQYISMDNVQSLIQYFPKIRLHA